MFTPAKSSTVDFDVASGTSFVAGKIFTVQAKVYQQVVGCTAEYFRFLNSNEMSLA